MKHLHGLLTKTPKPRLLHWGSESISWMSDWSLDSIINGLYACITQCFIIVSSADQNPFLRDMIMHWFRSITIKLCNHSKRKRTGLVLKRKMPVKTNIMVTVVGGSIQAKPRPYASLLLKYQQDSEWTPKLTRLNCVRLGTDDEIRKWHKCRESHIMIPRPASQDQLQLSDIIPRAQSSHTALHVNKPQGPDHYRLSLSGM